MAYTNIWNEALPNGTEAANTIDNIFRSLKLDIDQRLSDIFGGIPSFATDPLRPYGLKFTDAQDSIINLGDAGAGVARSINFNNKANSSTYFVIASNGITSNIAFFCTTISATTITASGQITGLDFIAASSNSILFANRSRIQSTADSKLLLINNGLTDFNLLQFGGTTASFPALQRSTSGLLVRLADDSGYSFLRAASLLSDNINFSSFAGQAKIIGGTTGVVIRNNADLSNLFTIDNTGVIAIASTLSTGGSITSGAALIADANSVIKWTGRSTLTSSTDGTILIGNNSLTDFNLLKFGGVSASFPAIKRNGAAFDFRLADDSGYAALNMGVLNLYDNLGGSTNIGHQTNVFGFEANTATWQSGKTSNVANLGSTTFPIVVYNSFFTPIFALLDAGGLWLDKCAAPTAVNRGGWIYIDAVDNKLKFKGSAGTITILALP